MTSKRSEKSPTAVTAPPEVRNENCNDSDFLRADIVSNLNDSIVALHASLDPKTVVETLITQLRRCFTDCFVNLNFRHSAILASAFDDWRATANPSSRRTQDGSHSYWLRIPIQQQSRRLGMIELERWSHAGFSSAEIAFAAALADHAGGALANAETFKYHSDQTRQLERQILSHRRTEKQLVKTRADLQRLTLRMQTMRDAERDQIARDIHDELAQALTALKLDTSWLQSHLSAGPDQLSQKTKAMNSLIDATANTVRKICATLRPPVLNHGSFIEAIQWQVHEFETRTGIPCYLSIPPGEIAMSQHHSAAVFRVIQEALNNISRHASATAAKLTLSIDDTDLVLQISDNGRGISPQAIYAPSSFGLLGMRERILLLKGEFNIRGAKNNGTTLSIRVPKFSSAEQ